MPRKVRGSMRTMKARQTGRLQRTDGSAPNPPEDEPRGELPDAEDELEEPLDDGMLVDQGDGMRVLKRAARRGPDDQDSHECPDEPPEGWGEG